MTTETLNFWYGDALVLKCHVKKTGTAQRRLFGALKFPNLSGFGCWGISTPKNGTGIALSVDELCGPKYFSAEAHSAMAGLDIFPVGRPDVQAVLGVSLPCQLSLIGRELQHKQSLA